MASSDEQQQGCESIDWAKWRDEERERRNIGADEVWEDGRVSRGTQTVESNFVKERPMAIVMPNSHLRDAVAWRRDKSE